MSAPFAGPPVLPFGKDDEPPHAGALVQDTIHDELAKLPRPRKHYQWYYSTREADADMRGAAQGIHAFLRAYYHFKSADWKQNQPFPLESWRATELANLPAYYVMDLHKGMADTVAAEMPSPADVAACEWLPDSELQEYTRQFTRTGFQGGLQWYRCATDPKYRPELETYSGRTIAVPSCFIAGASDWGVYQRPGAFEAMQQSVCTQLRGVHLVTGAGHWVQQEQPQKTSRLLLDFLRQA